MIRHARRAIPQQTDGDLVDPNALFLADDAGAEQRLVAIGMSEQMRILFVVHIERGQRDRIIRARVATRAEETLYEQGS